MHIGLSRPTAPNYPVADVDAALVALRADELGFESFLFGEHPIRPLAEQTVNAVHTEGVPYFQEAIVALSRISAMTRTIRFGFGVCLVVQHNPVRLAKQLACLDFYSGGRLMVGVGTGWSRVECEVMGGNFDRRWARTREAIQLMRRLWSEKRVEFTGEFNRVPPVHCFPQPAQQPGPPILIGANADSAFARIAEYGDGWMPAMVTPEQIADGPELIERGRGRILAVARKEYQRSMDSLPITCILRGNVDRQVIRRYADAGVDRVNIIIPYYETIEQAHQQLDKLAERVL